MISLDDSIRFKKWFVPLGINECWNWIGSKDKDGYGNFKISGSQQRANRISYILYIGDFDPSLYVLHSCDNPSCVNPAHLFLGTKDDNTKDMQGKGRHAGRPTPACKEEILKILRVSAMSSAAMVRSILGICREM